MQKLWRVVQERYGESAMDCTEHADRGDKVDFGLVAHRG